MSDDREFRAEPVEVRVTDKRLSAEDASPADEAPSVEVADPAARDAGDVTGAPADELEAARSEAASHLEDLKRLKAEFDNYRKRVTREQTALIERASDAVVERLLPVLDNFELALIAADRGKDYESLARGVEMVYAELRELLQKEGLERIDSLHQPFDPELHEAVMRTEGDGDLVVLEEMRSGYKIGGRVVRPAMVKVGPREEQESS